MYRHRHAIVTALLATAVLTFVSRAGSAQTPQTPALTKPVAASSATGVVTPDDYVIGAEDVIAVLFWREPEMSGDLTVRPDGKITLPLIGELVAVGHTPDALRAEIQKASTKYLADANVTVVVRQINSRRVFITGQVTKPGAFPLSSLRTVMQLIALAGGLNEYADGDHITIMRGTQLFKFNYKAVSKGRSLEQNIPLQPGDTVIVP
jgi:polysaccharide biosynthesis/export protein